MPPYPSRKPFRKGILLLSLFLALCGCVLWPAGECWSLQPGEILVIANRNVPESKTLAFYYMTRRNIPAQNLLVLSLTDQEHCTREEYNREAVGPVRAFLREKDPGNRRFRCIVTMYGVPLAVNGSDMNRKDREALTALRERVRDIRLRMAALPKGDTDKENAYKETIRRLERQMTAITKASNSASFDSEIALVLQDDYPLAGWVPNPLFLGYRGRKIKDMPARAFMVARLDGPTRQIVTRIIDDSLAAEVKGLRGTAYFDARWPEPEAKKAADGYTLYDRSLHRAAKRLRDSGVMPVVLDQKERLFQPGEAPHAAIYCGWYSLAKYVDAFTWVPGAVGYHIASAECDTLRQPRSQVWCKSMLEKGVAATLGPVGEPYVQAFPLPEIFFALLAGGRLTLAECYALSNPFLSWKMLLIGDPLYRPFKYRINGAKNGRHPS